MTGRGGGADPHRVALLFGGAYLMLSFHASILFTGWMAETAQKSSQSNDKYRQQLNDLYRRYFERGRPASMEGDFEVQIAAAVAWPLDRR